MMASGSSGVSQRSTSSKSALVTRPAVGMPGTWMRVGTRVATSKTWYFAHSPCSPLPVRTQRRQRCRSESAGQMKR